MFYAQLTFAVISGRSLKGNGQSAGDSWPWNVENVEIFAYFRQIFIEQPADAS